MITKQEIFDTVVRHLWAQGEQAIDRGVCQYRAPGGLKCAVGILIPDDKYDPKMDGSMILREVMFRVELGQEHFGFLSELQAAHDTCHNWDPTGPNDEMVKALTKIAETFGLSTTALMDEVQKS